MPSRVVVLVVTDPAGMVHTVRSRHAWAHAGMVMLGGRWMLVAKTDSANACRARVLGAGEAWAVLPLRRRRGEEQ